MLSGEGNAGERWKTTIGLISKKATLHVQHTFLYISLPLFCTTVTWNFQKIPSYTFYGGNVGRVLVHSFFTVAHFHPGGRWYPAATKFHIVPPKENVSFCFFSLALAPFLIEVSLACRPTFSFSLSFSFSIFQICGHGDKCKLNTVENTDTETISFFRFRLYWLLSCLCFARRGWPYAFPPNW